jgi:chaperonin GroEL
LPEDGAVVVGKLLEANEYSYGYDAQTGEYGDLAGRGIIDPTKVVRTALQDAASIAGLIVTTEAMLTDANPTPNRGSEFSRSPPIATL